MTTIKMKHFFNLALTCLTISLAVSAVFAETVAGGKTDRITKVCKPLPL